MSLFDVTKNANEVLQYLLFLQPVYALGYSLFEIVLYSVNDQYESQLHTGVGSCCMNIDWQ